MMSKLVKYLAWSVLIIFAYIPFHALISTWLISNLGLKELFKSLKDILVALQVVVVVVLFFRFHIKLSNTEKLIAFLLFAYLLINVMLIPFSKSAGQVMAGLDINLRFLAFFVVCYFLVRWYEDRKFVWLAIKTITYCGMLVCTFGLMQVLFLPKDFLGHFGYGKWTILPYQLIDNNENSVRIISTLRGPNSLGAYLVTIGGMLIEKAGAVKLNKKLWLLIGLLFSISMAKTYSRAAWLGFFIASIIFLIIKYKHYIKSLTPLLLGGIIVFSVLLVEFRNNSFVSNIFFHVDPKESSQVDSDIVRVGTLRTALQDIGERPFGHGVGSSGIASLQGDNPYITENYFLEIAYQLGVPGVMVFLAIEGTVLWMIIKKRSLMLLATFVGLNIACMFWPALSDETVAYSWWGLAGILLATPASKKLQKSLK